MNEKYNETNSLCDDMIQKIEQFDESLTNLKATYHSSQSGSDALDSKVTLIVDKYGCILLQLVDRCKKWLSKNYTKKLFKSLQYQNDFEYLGKQLANLKVMLVENVTRAQGERMDKVENKIVDFMNEMKEMFERKDNADCQAFKQVLSSYFGEQPMAGAHDRLSNDFQRLQLNDFSVQDMRRDYGYEGAYALLTVVQALTHPTKTLICQSLSGVQLQAYQYKRGQSITSVKRNVTNCLRLPPNGFSDEYFVALLSEMTNNGLLTTSPYTTKDGKPYNAYQATSHGVNVLSNYLPVMLLDIGHRDAREKWQNYLERNSNNEQRLIALGQLFDQIEQWRAETAQQDKVDPIDVVSEHTLVSIAYNVVTMSNGKRIDQQTLAKTGVKASTNKISLLESIIRLWVDENEQVTFSTHVGPDGRAAKQMVLGIVQGNKWEYAGPDGFAWKASYKRYNNGETPLIIAMTQPTGKGIIKELTVVEHILKAIDQGKCVDLTNLGPYVPNECEWNKLKQVEEEEEEEKRMSVAGNPDISGRKGMSFTMKDFLRPILGDEFISKSKRTEEEKKTFERWCICLRVYQSLR